MRPVTAVNWAYKRCFIRHITCKMKWKWHQTFSKDSVPSEIQWYITFWFLNVHYVLMFIQQSLLEKFWYCGGSPQINKCMYVKHTPQHNNLNPTSLLITLTVSVAGATNQPDIQTQTPVLTSVRVRAHDETVYKTFFTNVKSAYYNDFWRIMWHQRLE